MHEHTFKTNNDVDVERDIIYLRFVVIITNHNAVALFTALPFCFACAEFAFEKGVRNTLL